jgi:3-dehydroquinate dehydratase/alpha-beta hydrolase superfamily lysophospholipase
MVKRDGADLGLEIETFQSNHEGAIIDRLHAARDTVDGIVINSGAFTHYSYAIHDALLATDLPAVEVHISNIHAREPWRRVSVTAPACRYVVFGRGLRGYRDAMIRLITEEQHTPLRVHYGDETDQFGELRLPPTAGPAPVAVLVHGGFWRDPYTLDLMDRLAVDLTARGWAAWNIEYRRVGNGGGVPETLDDVAAAVDHLAGLDPTLDVDKVGVIGHSAGGQLALWAAHRPDARVTPAAVVSLAGVCDLEAARAQGLGDHAVAGLFGSNPEVDLATVSPAHMPPPRCPTLVVHGMADDRVPFDQSHRFQEMNAVRGTPIDLIRLEGVDHFDVIDPGSAGWRDTMYWLERQIRRPG